MSIKFIYTAADKTLHTVFHAMKARCYNPKNKQFKDYGGRGITICKEWLDSPRKFIDWALSNGWQEGLQIDRKNNDGNYTDLNCRFVPQLQNVRNTRSNVLIEYLGYQKCLSEWCELLSLPYNKTYHRLMGAKWSVEKCFSVEFRNNN